MSSTKDRRWWSVPKTFSGFSLWRLTNPFLDTVDSTSEHKANSRKDEEQDEEEEEEMKQNKFRNGGNINDDDKENNADAELNHEKLKKLRRSRSRSRSSSFSRKSVERSTMSIDVKDDKQQLCNSSDSSSAAALPEISFSFYNEKEDEYIIVDSSVIVKQERQDSVVADKSDDTDDKRKSEIKIDLDRVETEETNEKEEEIESQEEKDDISIHDSRLRQVVDNETSDSCQTEETRHVSSITLAVRSSASYTNTEELKSITSSFICEEAAKENDYETLREESTTDCFASRKDSLSSSASFPIYAIIDKNHNDDDNNRSNTLPSSLGVGHNETVPELPNPDWEETNSDDNPDYAELTTPVDNNSLETDDNKDYAECEERNRLEIEGVRNEEGETEEPDAKGQYEDMEYCQHRAELKPSKRRVTLLRNRKRPSIGKVRLRINKTWMRVKCWWLEERLKIGEVISRHTKSDNNDEVCYADSVETAEKEDNRISPVVYLIQEDAVTRDTGGRCTEGEIVLQQQQQPETITEQDDENDDYVDLKSDGGDSSQIASTVSTMRMVKRRKSSNNNGIGSPLPALSRSSSIAAFRRSRFIPANPMVSVFDSRVSRVRSISGKIVYNDI